MEAIVAELAQPVITGLFAFVGCFVALRTDIVWIKKILDRHETLILDIYESYGSRPLVIQSNRKNK